MRKQALAYRCVVALMLVVVLPAAASAQASITGVVRDPSGAVLPGVTVEAASPVLIEKVRSVASDGGGQYRIVDLRPGSYTVTFTLPGFNTLRREGIELSGDFTATINAELRVGALEETVTVTGEAPTVDVQGVARQRVLSNEIVDSIPTGMYYTSLGLLVPGVSVSCTGACSGSSHDVGGAAGDSRSQLVVHGSRFRDQRMSVNGMNFTGSSGGVLRNGPNVSAMEEVQIETSGIDASMGTGGVRVNLVPKDGGNTFSGSLFATYSNGDFQSNNISQDLIDRGLKGVGTIKRLYEVAPTFGGPIAKDKLWFFLAMRRNDNLNNIPSKFANKNQAPNLWTYEPDLSKPATERSRQTSGGARVTWQATPRNKVAASLDIRSLCICPDMRSGTASLEAVYDRGYVPDNFGLLTWSSPVTNRLLLEAGVAVHVAGVTRTLSPFTDNTLIRVVEQSPPDSYLGVTTYRGIGPASHTRDPFRNTAFTVTYVTGAHALKAGVNHNWGYSRNYTGGAHPIIANYTFNKGVPVSFTVDSNPRFNENRIKSDFGLYVQDKWTYRQMTLSGGLRYDYVNKYSPEQALGPAPLLPDRNLVFPEIRINGYHDLSPRVGLAYDLFGTGKTALKVALNRYVADASLGSGSNVFIGSPINLYQFTASRAWTDGNGNFYPDCDWANPNRQDNRASGGDLCGAFVGASATFGTTRPGTVTEREVIFGWGNRGHNWEFSTSVQHELLPRVGIDVGYFRRWYGNFTVTDNMATAASDYSPFSVTVPTDPGLPLSGQTIQGFLNVNPDKATATDNHIWLSDRYGDQSEYWHGVDVNTSVRLQGGLLVQGGVSTGKTVRDNCEVQAQVPETGFTVQQSGSADDVLLTVAGPLGVPFCHQDSGFRTQVKLLGSYTIPRVDVQLGGTFQSIPGPMVVANFVVPNAVVKQSLGRDLSGNAANVTVNIVEPGSLYGDRVNQIDFRVGKILRFAGTRRVTASVDLFNVLNSNAVLVENSAYTAFRRPSEVMQGRLLKFTVVTNF